MLDQSLLQAAMTQHRQGDRGEAEKLYRRFLDEHPDNPDALQLYGLLCQNMGQYERADSLMRQSIAKVPEQPHVHNNLGNVQRALGREKDAIACYRTATELKGDYAEAWHNLGLALRSTEELDQAIDALRTAVSVHPKYHQAYNSLGNVLKDAGKIDEAVAAYHKALEIRPDYLKAMHNLGVALRLSGNLEGAIECYRKVLKGDPNIAEAHYNLANALQLLEKVEEAEASYNKAIELRPDFEEAHYDLNQLLWTRGDSNKFLQSYPAAIQRKPDSLDLWLRYVERLISAKASTPAEETLRAAIQHFGQKPELLNLLGKTLAHQRREEEALVYHQNCLDLVDDDPQYLLSYADTLLRIHEYEAALEIMNSAVALDPLDQELIAYQSDCWRFLGDKRYDIVNDYQRMVRVFKLPLPAGYNDSSAFCRDLFHALTPLHSETRNHPMDQTLRGGSQSYEGLFDKDIEMVQLYKQSFEKVIQEYIADLDDDPTHPLFSRKCKKTRFTGSFTVRLRKQGWHTNHVHPAGWLSSCFYVQLPKVVANENTREGWIHFGQPGARYDPPVEPMRYIQPAEGVVAVFPSYLWHGTVPFSSNETRTTVVSDIVPDD
ncbi:MAG: tetratricopeptide repeat protein [Sphingomonadales bacterium]